MDSIQVVQILGKAADKVAGSVREELVQRMVQIIRGEAEFATSTIVAPGVRIFLLCGDVLRGEGNESVLDMAMQVAGESAKGYLAGVCGQPEDAERDLEEVHEERLQTLAKMQELVGDLLHHNFAGSISADKAKSALLWTAAAWPEKVVL